MPTPVYLDYAATTPTGPAVVAVMTRYLGPDGVFGSPASRLHGFGRDAEEAVEQARLHVADLINADPREIVWTSGATESDNLAIKGAAARGGRGGQVVTSAIEHKAVLDSCLHLERNGFEVTRIAPGADGLITPERVESALRDDTILLSLMHVNNEIGAITDIETIGRLARDRGIPLHVDAAQSAARVRLDVQREHADSVSLSAHKMYGPKGVGALYVRRWPRARLEPQIHGGGHERGLRSGTLPTHQIAGMGEAARLLAKRWSREAEHIRDLEGRFLGQLGAVYPPCRRRRQPRTHVGMTEQPTVIESSAVTLLPTSLRRTLHRNRGTRAGTIGSRSMLRSSFRTSTTQSVRPPVVTSWAR